MMLKLLETLLVVASHYSLPVTFFSFMLTVTAGNVIISVDSLFLCLASIFCRHMFSIYQQRFAGKNNARKMSGVTKLLTLNLLTTTIVAPPSNANKWLMGFN